MIKIQIMNNRRENIREKKEQKIIQNWITQKKMKEMSYKMKNYF